MQRRINFDFIGRYKLWFAVSGAIVLVSVASLALRGLNLSIEFSGGSSFTLAGVSEEVTADELEDQAQEAGASQVKAQLVRDGGQVTGAIVQTEAIEPGSETEVAISEGLREVSQADDVQVSFVGPTWGDRISRKMLQALLVFLGVVILYITLRLEFKMAMAAIVALIHDVALTAGVYALFQFNVSPATVIALLTILGYSLYDTVIVFDRIKENMDRLGRPGYRSYGLAVNASMNEVLWRSLNTTVTSSLPVAALLFIGSQALGAVTLQDLALALFVGMITGAYSSLFIAGPTLVLWKEREPKMADLARKAERYDDDELPERVTVPAEKAEKAEDAGGDEPRLRPRGYVRGSGKKPRRKR